MYSKVYSKDINIIVILSNSHVCIMRRIGFVSVEICSFKDCPVGRVAKKNIAQNDSPTHDHGQKMPSFLAFVGSFPQASHDISLYTWWQDLGHWQFALSLARDEENSRKRRDVPHFGVTGSRSRWWTRRAARHQKKCQDLERRPEWLFIRSANGWRSSGRPRRRDVARWSLSNVHTAHRTSGHTTSNDKEANICTSMIAKSH